MYGTWCKAQFIPEKLTVKMGNNGHQQGAPRIMHIRKDTRAHMLASQQRMRMMGAKVGLADP